MAVFLKIYIVKYFKIKMNPNNYKTLGKIATSFLQAFGLTTAFVYITMPDTLAKKDYLVLTGAAIIYSRGKQLENKINEENNLTYSF